VFGELIRVVRKESIRAEQFATQPVALAIVATFTVAWFMLFPATFGWGAIMTLGAWITMPLVARTKGGVVPQFEFDAISERIASWSK
jgi:hypothetical protein